MHFCGLGSIVWSCPSLFGCGGRRWCRTGNRNLDYHWGSFSRRFQASCSLWALLLWRELNESGERPGQGPAAGRNWTKQTGRWTKWNKSPSYKTPCWWRASLCGGKNRLQRMSQTRIWSEKVQWVCLQFTVTPLCAVACLTVFNGPIVKYKSNPRPQALNSQTENWGRVF